MMVFWSFSAVWADWSAGGCIVHALPAARTKAEAERDAAQQVIPPIFYFLHGFVFTLILFRRFIGMFLVDGSCDVSCHCEHEWIFFEWNFPGK